MEVVGSAANVIAVIELTAKVASLCFQYCSAVKNAPADVQRLQGELERLKTTLQGAQRLLESPSGERLQTSQGLRSGLIDCSSQLTELRSKLEKKLNPGSARKAMSRIGFRALKWPFESKEVDNIIKHLERYRDTLSAGLAIDGATQVLDVGHTLVLSKLPTANSASFDSHADEHDGRCLPGTRVDLQREIMKWADDPQGKCIFWLKGMAGTGKSTISRTVAESFAKKGVLGASFFFKRGERDRGNAALLFPTIASQLVVAEPAVAAHIRAAIDADPHVIDKHLQEQFEKLVLEPLGKLKGDPNNAKTFVIVLDALDECDRDPDIKLIIRLLSKAKDLSSVRLKAFVTSRPELPIRHGFVKIEGNYHDLVLHEVAPAIIEHDIGAFLRFRFAEIRGDYNDLHRGSKQELPLEWPGPDVVHTLVQMAVPLFIFAATVCRFVQESGYDPRQQLAQVLEYRETTHRSEIDKLDATYRPVLDRLLVGSEATKRSVVARFRDVVGSIVLLAEPLSIPSLARLLKVPGGIIFHELEPLHSVLRVPASADSESPVRTFHLSFRDFLVDPDKADEQDKYQFWVDERKTHERLAVRCLELLSTDDTLEKDVCGLRLPGTRRAEVDKRIINTHLPPDVQYACRYWVYHWKESKRLIQDDDPIDVFLTRHLLHWLEALAFLGWVSESIGMVDDLRGSLDPEGSSKVSAFLLDTKRFIQSYCSIFDMYPLQVYSAIVFAPEQSVVRRTFRGQFPGWLALPPKVESDWDACIQTLEGHTKSANSIALSHDSKMLASASSDNTIKLWDAATGACTETLKGHAGPVNSVAFSHERMLASASSDKTIKLWDAITGECTATLEGHTGAVNSVAFSGSHDPKMLVSASSDKTIKLWDAVTGTCTATLKGHSESVNSAVFSYNSKMLASGSSDETIKLWDATTGTCTATLNGHTRSVNSVAFSHDSKILASGSFDKTIKLWDTTTRTCTATLEGHYRLVYSIAFSHDSKMLVSASFDHTIKLWDTTTRTCTATLEGHTASVNSVVFSNNSKTVASASNDKTIKLWDATTSDSIDTLERHFGLVKSVVFSYDSKMLASVSPEEGIKLWNAENGDVIRALWGHTYAVALVAFSHDSKMLASASFDNTIKIWDTSTGACIATHRVKGDRVVASLAFDKTGFFLLTDIGTFTLSNLSLSPTDSTATLALEASEAVPSPLLQPVNSSDIGLSEDKAWVTWGSHKVLWLPPTYRPGSWDVTASTVAIGRPSGRVSLFAFSFSHDLLV